MEELNLLVNKIQPVLTELSAKLGVAGENLWKILIKQQYVDGFISLIDMLLIGGIIAGIIWIMRKNWNAVKDEGGVWVIVFFVGIFLILLFAHAYTGAIEHFVNPEYQALEDIFKMINPSQ